MRQKVGYTYEFDASCANGALDNNFSECKRSVATYKLGNMKTKKSSEVTVTGSKKGDDLNYEFDYEVEEGCAHRYARIGTRYYKYDEVGNLLAEQTGAFGTEDDDNLYKIEELKEKTYGMNEGWGVFNKDETAEGSGIHHRKTDRRTYEWNAENQLVETSDEAITVGYTYGADGKRASKYTHNSETLYFNDYWVWHIDNATKDRGGKVTKNIYLGTERLASRIGSYNTYSGEENENTFFYHSDHLGSAQLVTDCNGDEYQRIEYTPYGETWIDLKTQISLIAKLPYKFSAKELDEETGLYYYGARYLDPKYSRWISADPAMNTGEYFPVAPTSDEAKRHNGNLPGMGGIFNHINFHLYHYASNNPVRYTDPDGRDHGVPPVIQACLWKYFSSQEFDFTEYNRIQQCKKGPIKTFDDPVPLLKQHNHWKKDKETGKWIAKYPVACYYFSIIDSHLMKGYRPYCFTDIEAFVENNRKGTDFDVIVEKVFGMSVTYEEIPVGLDEASLLALIGDNPAILIYSQQEFWANPRLDPDGVHAIAFQGGNFYEPFCSRMDTDFNNIKIKKPEKNEDGTEKDPLKVNMYVKGYIFKPKNEN